MKNLYLVIYEAQGKSGNIFICDEFMTMAILRARRLLMPFGAHIMRAELA